MILIQFNLFIEKLFVETSLAAKYVLPEATVSKNTRCDQARTWTILLYAFESTNRLTLEIVHNDNSEKLGYSLMHAGIHNASGGHPAWSAYSCLVSSKLPRYSDCNGRHTFLLCVNSRQINSVLNRSPETRIAGTGQNPFVRYLYVHAEEMRDRYVSHNTCMRYFSSIRNTTPARRR